MAEQADYVTLVSSDGYSYVVQRSAACISPAIRRMLDPANGFLESKTGVIRFDNFHAILLETIVKYMYYNEKNKDARDIADMDFPDSLCLELVWAADYLDI
ncbi:hypothetical protein BAUCODRAFT_303309 [Baudoinia panamericana UAMH 10762]|uniref:Elongin-C n=1 Tax=Baudoinia panamericana (strain UAMH 10762) TaxID=717646 RepID=M2M559_BAUPA|nr:uncharacterized protein BAUCODRAFT_303309 [Baudoinia panamericana UAMH 10762]EMC91756.1 hypothetical protein BAUCODRAFT_303309 [Baudoinia panamericana UAMH 10762]